jgi:hypothetical protein
MVQVVPRLRPMSCGIGDYAWTLAEGCRENHGIGTKFFVADPAWQGTAGIESDVSTSTLTGRNADALVELWKDLGGRELLLH